MLPKFGAKNLSVEGNERCLESAHAGIVDVVCKELRRQERWIRRAEVMSDWCLSTHLAPRLQPTQHCNHLDQEATSKLL